MEQQTEELRRCRRCLTRELAGKEETFRSLYEYIANLESDLKAEEKEYEARLLVCKNCDMLLQGMCRKCGCYVELRAVLEKNRCPDRRW